MIQTDGAGNDPGTRMSPRAPCGSVSGSRDSRASARERWSEAGHVSSGSHKVVVHTTMESYERPKHRLVRFLSLSPRRRATIDVGVHMQHFIHVTFEQNNLSTDSI